MQQEVFDFLKGCGTYYLATVEGDQPRVRPFSSLNAYQGRLYFQTGKVKKVAHQLKENGRVELCGMSKGAWIRVSGTAVLDESTEAQQSMFDANPGLEKMYAVNDGNNEVYYLEAAVADIYSFGEDPRHFEF